jgi:membrane fusion protein (multidrug efflux system)
MSFMRSKLLAGVVAAALAAGGAGAWFYGERSGEAGGSAAADDQAQPEAVAVEARPVSLGTVSNEVSAVGTLRSNEAVVIRPEIDGRVTEIHFDEGAPVDQGQLLFSFDDQVPRAELADAEANLALSERNYQRAMELYRRGAGTGRSVDETRASLQSDRAKVDLAKARLDKTRIVAPFAGIVGLRRVSIGDYVSSGDDLVTLASIDPIKVDFRIPERFLSNLHPGQELGVEVDAFPGRTFRGQVFAVDPQIDANGRSIALRAEVPNAERLLRPGLFSRIRLVLDVRDNAITIPEEAIVPQGEQRFVYTVVGEHAVKTRVTLGHRGPGWVEVTSGLKGGDVVVTAGQLRIRDGATVEVVAPTMAAPGAGA